MLMKIYVIKLVSCLKFSSGKSIKRFYRKKFRHYPSIAQVPIINHIYLNSMRVINSCRLSYYITAEYQIVVGIPLKLRSLSNVTLSNLPSFSF